MIECDGKLLIKHLQSTRIKASADDREALDVANKLVFDFAAAFGSFIEYIEKKVAGKHPKIEDE